MLGPHLMLDLYNCNPSKLSNMEFIFSILDELPELVGMTKISKPDITYYPGSEQSFDKGGLSGFVLIAESHMTIHTFVADSFASVDIFSCKDFDMEKAVSFIVERLEAKKVDRNVVIRGKEFIKHYPNDVSKAKAIVENQRKLF